MTEARYYNQFRVLRSVSPGRVLAHNHVQHTIDMPNGLNGFRYWTWPKGKVPRRCKCGWAGLPHYQLRSEDKAGRRGSRHLHRANVYVISRRS
jgi:hypothetical protein